MSSELFAGRYSTIDSLRSCIGRRARERGFIISMKRCHSTTCDIEGPCHVTLSSADQRAVTMSAREADELLNAWPILPKYTAINTANTKRARAKNRKERVLIDGRLVAVKAKTHGTHDTYNEHGCRCVPCTEAANKTRFAYD